MADVVFKTQTARTEPTKSSDVSNVKHKDSGTVSTSTVEVPYLDYRGEHGEPHSVGFFGLGDMWDDPDGGFSKEVGMIEDYFRTKIEGGDMANSVSAVKDRLKEILKVTNMNKEERNIIKVSTVAAYIKFLSDTDDVKHSVKRYGNA